MNRSLKTAVSYVLALALAGALACVAMVLPVPAGAMTLAAGAPHCDHSAGHVPGAAAAACALVCPPLQVAPPLRVAEPVGTFVCEITPPPPRPLPPGTSLAPEPPPPR